MKKFYTFAMILYKDSTSYNYYEILDYITKNWKQYAYIEHLPDVDSKKVHTHLLVHFDNKRYASAISKELNLPINYIQSANLIPYLRYLIHFDDEDKIQYSIEQVVGPLQSKLRSILSSSKLEEPEQVSMIFDYIAESSSYMTHTELLQYVLKVGCYSAYRRNFSLFNQLILEHNKFM